MRSRRTESEQREDYDVEVSLMKFHALRLESSRNQAKKVNKFQKKNYFQFISLSIFSAFFCLNFFLFKENDPKFLIFNTSKSRFIVYALLRFVFNGTISSSLKLSTKCINFKMWFPLRKVVLTVALSLFLQQSKYRAYYSLPFADHSVEFEMMFHCLVASTKE